MMKRKTGFCVIIAFFIFRGALANIFYVSTTGNDTSGDGSAGNPWRTLKFAAMNVPANQGHTIQISAGTYLEMGPIEIPPGVNVTGAGKNLTILKAVSSFYYHPASPGYATDKFLISLKSASQVNGNQSLKHFTIDGDSKQLHGGIYVRYRSRVTIESVKVHDTNFTGIWLWDVKDSRITNTELINCSWGSSGYCVGALNLGNIERVEIDQLKVDESVGYGIKAIGPSGYNDIFSLKIHDSRISVHPYGLWNNGSAPNIAIELWQVNLVKCEIYNTYVDNTISLVNSNANPSTGVQTIRVHHNTIDLETRARGAGYGLELTIHDAEIDHNYFIKGRYGIVNWDNPMKNWNIHHNTFYALSGVYPGDIVRSQWSGLHNVNFYNNTIEFTGDKTMNVIGIYGGTSGNVNLTNNLIINNNVGYSYYPNALVHMENGATLNNLTVKNNLLDRLPMGSIPGTYSGNRTGDPKISRSGSRPEGYYNPVAGSPLIDNGLNVALSFLGLAPDIGAFEYQFSLLNLTPTVNLTSPANNSSVVEGSSVMMKAHASDLDGNITKVEFFQGTTKLGEDFNSPYAFEWSNTLPGSYSLTAKATDNVGAVTSSAPVAITVVNQNQGPVVTITSPANHATFPAGSTVTIGATTSDRDGSVSKVEFFQGTTKLGEDLTSPYSFDWINVATGTYSITAKATDDEGSTATSAAVSITLSNRSEPPTDGEELTKLGLYAPDATLSGNMKLTGDPTASKGSYFSVPVGSGKNYAIPPRSNAEFNFILKKTDTYVVWVRIKSPTPNNQGYYLYDGKGNWTAWLAGVHTEWTWVKATNAYTDEVATFPFTAGSNIFRMAWFHENVQVDRILITNDLNYIPEEETESETTDPSFNLGLYAPDATLTGNMKLSSDATASKGSYFSMPEGYGNNYYIPVASNAEFHFQIDKAADYVVWARIKSPTDHNQGFHIYDGKGNWTTWLAGVHTEWTWVKVTNAYTKEVATFPYSEGLNILRMAWFHDNVQVDAIIITNDHTFIPSDKDSHTLARTHMGKRNRSQEETKPAMEVFPNPVRDKFTITYTSASEQEARITIKSVLTLASTEMFVGLVRGPNNINVDMQGAQKGLYLVSIHTADGDRFLQKVMVVK